MKRVLSLLSVFILITTVVLAGGSLLYQNSRFGFQLTLPASWKGYKVFEVQTNWPGSVKAPTLYVCLQTNDKNWSNSQGIPHGYAALLAITAYTPVHLKKINEALKRGEDPTMIEIVPAKSGKHYHFTYEGPQAAPSDLNDRVGEIEGILKTFNLMP